MNLLRNISIRYKVLAVGVVGVLGFVTYIAVDYSASKANALRLSALKNMQFPAMELAGQNLHQLGKLRQDLTLAVSADEESLVEQAQQVHNEMQNNLQLIASMQQSYGVEIEIIATGLAQYFNMTKTFALEMMRGDIDFSSVKDTATEIAEQARIVEAGLKEFHEARYADFNNTIESINAQSHKTLQIGGVIAMGTLLLLVMSALYISGMIASDVRSVVDSLKAIASGDLTRTLSSKGKDEVGEMVASSNTFVQRLRAIISEVVSSTTQLATAAGKTNTIVAQAHKDVDLQHQETEHLSASVNEMFSAAQAVASNASCAAEAARQANGEAATGQQVVATTIDVINELASEVNRTAAAINVLDQESGNIGKVLDVIRNIADQTNLLALNAAIEAARAGEQGRGFAVVADEVRTLAQKSAQSANEIREMIERLQKGAREAVDVMVHGRTQAKNSVEHAAKAGAVLNVIIQKISAINEMNAQIASAAEEQGVVAEEIKSNVSNIKEVAQRSADGAEHTSAASLELSKLAERLQGVVSQFKV